MIHRLKKEEPSKIFSDLYTLYSEFFLEQRTYSNRYQFKYSDEEFVKYLIDEIASDDVYVLLLSVNETVVGFLRGRKNGEAKSFMLHDLYIKPVYRGGGYGKQLFLSLKGELQKDEINNIDILVDLNNKAGVSFWEKMGFFPWQQKMSLHI